jgi:membrane protein implicated in regulation of membrane protease activity
MQDQKRQPTVNASMRATGWAGAVLAAIAVLGLLAAPSMRLIWIVMLVFAVAAVPQALAAERLQARRERERDGR